MLDKPHEITHPSSELWTLNRTVYCIPSCAFVKVLFKCRELDMATLEHILLGLAVRVLEDATVYRVSFYFY